MGERRKLQTEIDRVLKKVAEGVETFEDIWTKCQTTTNQSQKEKFELEMKKEIKKLQRLRDQIKNWQASNEVKDKTGLVETRRTVEKLMERFKVVEKESKTKAYSKEGLGACQRLDPHEKEKEEAIHWIQQAIDSLKQSTDAYEAEAEAITVSLAKKRRRDEKLTSRLEELKGLIVKNNSHTEGLERALRLVDNDAIDMKRIDDLHGDVDSYIQNGPEHDYEDEDLLCHDMFSEDAEPFAVAKQEAESRSGARRSEGDDSKVATTTVPAATLVAAPSVPAVVVAEHPHHHPTRQQSYPSTKLRINSHPPLLTNTPNTPSNSSSRKPSNRQEDGCFVFTPSIQAQQHQNSTQQQQRSMHTVVQGMSTSLQSLPTAPQPSVWKKNHNTRRSMDCVDKVSNNNNDNPIETSPRRTSASSFSLDQKVEFNLLKEPGIEEVEKADPEPIQTDISSCSNSNKNEQSCEDDSKEEFLRQVKMSYDQLPSLSDVHSERSVVGRLPVRRNNDHFLFNAPLFDKYEQFVQLSTETLFFIFYHFEGTVSQRHAAKALKSRSWRFHTKHMMWFQRHEEPIIIKDDFEQGAYIYFDYEEWVQKRRDNFFFEYRYLEDKEM